MNNNSNERPVARFIEKWRFLGHIHEEYAKSRGMTLMAFMVLEIIYMNPGCCTQKLICEQSLYAKQSVNAIIRTLWTRGYVVLNVDDRDRRNRSIVLTEKGQKYADKIIGEYLIVEKEAMEHLSGDQWEQLVGLAETYAEHFSAGMTKLIQASEEE